MGKSGRLKVLFIPSWYPSEEYPTEGVFVREHAKAAALYHDITVLYAYVDPSLQPWKLHRISRNIEDGIKTIRIKYADIFAYLKRLLTKEGRGEEGHSYSYSDSKIFNVLRKLFRIPRTILLNLLYLGIIFVAFRKLLKEGFKPDVIHAHVYSAGVPAVLLGNRYRIPVVVTEHFTGFPRGLVRGFERFKAKFAFERAAVVCPVSNDLRRHIERLGITARFQVVPNVVDTSLFSPPGVPDTREDSRKRLLVVAMLTPKKGIPYLLNGLARLKEKRDDFVLDVIGDGPNRGEYEKLTNKLGLRDIVSFHGLKTKQEVAEFMRQCDFFVLPSLFETFGVVLIEALACGKPVIASDIGGPNEIVTNEVGKLVPPGDSEALTEAIDYMLEHYQDYSPEKIARYAQERFSYKAVGQKLDEVYRYVIQKRGKAR